ncbi:chemotaxis protein CheD [Vibrio sp. SCSIO 43135]|uniref:chemotaxis protein CheD n=1 Tax=Vibrio sp. SCSIO 43135 TaxID=2819096 RepID=UPI0020753268|nr:chemotaxis protein CheD [Vibrio sp. SCSIO 43135]USD43375.1 chemotaxis protein CheD [Vibrio sp. SCSIO 43135]
MMALHTPRSDSDNTHISRFFHRKHQHHMVKVMPGGVYCTNTKEVICTGLGSCIAACVWDPEAHVGGMNHFLLPFDSKDQLRHWHPSDAVTTASRYGSHAMEMLINELIGLGAHRECLHTKLFGGAQMLGKHSMIGEKNIEFILNYVKQENLTVDALDLGGLEPRKVMFDPLSGKAWLKRIPFTEVHQVKHQEEQYASQLDKESHRSHDDDVELF